MNTNKVRWSQVYVDAFGLGNLTTGSIPAYDLTNPAVPVLFGVTGVDITVANLTDNGALMTVAQLEQLLFDASLGCPDFDLSQQQTCLLQGTHPCGYCSSSSLAAGAIAGIIIAALVVG